MLALKRIVDVDPRPGRFLITGSTNLVAMASIPDALPGRVDYFRLWSLTQRELSQSRSDALQHLIDNDPPRITGAPTGRRAYADRIVAGGYPDAVTRAPSRRARLLEGLITSTLSGDMKDLWSGEAEIAERALRHLASRSSEILNFASLGRDIGVAGATLKAHVRALEQLFLVRRHPAWSANIDQRLIKMPKAYIADPGMLCHLLGADARAIVEQDQVADRVFETFVATELVRLADASGRIDLRFFHYRDAHQREIDIILELPGGEIIAIEVKASATVDGRDFATMRRLRDALGDRFRCGYLLFAGDRTHRFDSNLHAVPISALWTDSE
jgi:predicted AAA+ superfamily ATPase